MHNRRLRQRSGHHTLPHPSPTPPCPQALRYKESTLQQLVKRINEAAMHRRGTSMEQGISKDWDAAQKTCEHLICINNELTLPQAFPSPALAPSAKRKPGRGCFAM